MLRNVSAAVLSLGLLSSALSLAQTATTTDGVPPPHHEGKDWGGPGRMGHGPMGLTPFGLHRVEGQVPASITNSPLTATFTATTSMQSRDGKQMEHSSTRLVYRDSLGRTREDITLPPPPPRTPQQGSATASASAAPATPQTPAAPRVITVIFDPVANTITRLNAERKVAVVETVPADFFKRGAEGKHFNSEHADANRTVTDLGSKTFAGVVAKGERTSRTMPGPGGDAARAMTREVWFSPDLKLQVSETETLPHGTHSDIVTSLSKVEPAASLFKVPEGYAIEQATKRPFHGGPHRGHDGDHGPDASPADAPPPAM